MFLIFSAMHAYCIFSLFMFSLDPDIYKPQHQEKNKISLRACQSQTEEGKKFYLSEI